MIVHKRGACRLSSRSLSQGIRRALLHPSSKITRSVELLQAYPFAIVLFVGKIWVTGFYMIFEPSSFRVNTERGKLGLWEADEMRKALSDCLISR